MARLKVSRGSVAIDTVPLPDRTARGKVSQAGNRFFLTVGKRRLQIPVGPIVSVADVRKMVGKDVAVAFSSKNRNEVVAIGTWPTPEKVSIGCYWILCYVPAPDIIRRVDPRVRRYLVREMVGQKVISAELGKQIEQRISARM